MYTELACAVIGQAVSDLREPLPNTKKRSVVIQAIKDKETAKEFLFKDGKLENFIVSFHLDLEPTAIRRGVCKDLLKK